MKAKELTYGEVDMGSYAWMETVTKKLSKSRYVSETVEGKKINRERKGEQNKKEEEKKEKK